MLSNAKLPNGFWVEEMATIVHIINRSTSKVLEKEAVAEMVWTCKPPYYKHLRVFGCEAYNHIPKEFRNKLEPKSKKCIFLGYGEFGAMGYKLWDPKFKKVLCGNDVYFNEANFCVKLEKIEEIR